MSHQHVCVQSRLQLTCNTFSDCPDRAGVTDGTKSRLRIYGAQSIVHVLTPTRRGQLKKTLMNRGWQVLQLQL